MKKLNLIVDVARCNNCSNCTLAMMDEYVGNDFPGYTASAEQGGAAWIQIKRRDRGEGSHIDVAYMPTMCNHCDNPPCAKGAEGIVIKRDDGIVLIDPQKSVGRRDIMARCPYGAITWNSELNIPQNWPFDAHLLDAGAAMPRCQNVCPSGVYETVRLTDRDMRARAQADGLAVRSPELGAMPRVFYKNLHRITSRMIGGSAFGRQNGVVDCVEGALVELRDSNQLLASVTTDVFGDFRFDGLPAEDKTYEVRISRAHFKSWRDKVTLSRHGVSMGEVVLESIGG